MFRSFFKVVSDLFIYFVSYSITSRIVVGADAPPPLAPTLQRNKPGSGQRSGGEAP